jgi:hypothetical protein
MSAVPPIASKFYAPQRKTPSAISGPSALQQTACLLGCLHNLHNPRHPDRKGRAAAEFTLDHDVPAHHLAEALTDREAKTRTAVFARGGRGSLRELLEQLAHLLWRHANAGIADSDGDPIRSYGLDYGVGMRSKIIPIALLGSVTAASAQYLGNPTANPYLPPAPPQPSGTFTNPYGNSFNSPKLYDSRGQFRGNVKSQPI